MLWLVTATLGDVPTAIIACVGLLLGVLIMARGTRGGAREAAPPRADEAPAPPGTTFRHGAIKLAPAAPGPGDANDAGTASTEAEAEAAAQAAAPEQPAAAQPEAPEQPAAAEPAAPVPPPLPQTPPTTFRQGSIRVGGIDRNRRNL